MSNSAESPQVVQEILTSLRKKQPDYRFDSLDNYSELQGKTTIGLIGPTGVGKTTLADKVIEIEPEIQPINTTTTRARREGDPVGFKTADEGITHTFMNEAVNAHQLVNYSVNDNGHIYGTFPEDFSAEYTIGPILTDSVENLVTAEFKDFYPIFVVARGGIYRQRLERERVAFPDIQKRLDEGLSSITWARLNVDAPWLSFIDTGDSAEELTEAAKSVVRIKDQRTHPNMIIPRRIMLLDEMEAAIHTVSAQIR